MHLKSEQFFFVLFGYATLELNGEAFELGENQGFRVTSSTLHLLSHLGQADLYFIVISTPYRHGDRVEIRV